MTDCDYEIHEQAPVDEERHPMVNVDTCVTFGTPIGIDVGRRNSLALAPADADPQVTEAYVVDEPCLETHYAALRRRDDHHGDPVVAAGRERLEALLDDVTGDALAYIKSFDGPVLVLEDLSYPERDLANCLADGAEPECWLLPALQERLTEQATAIGIPVMVVSEKYTTRQCHGCGQFARLSDEILRCTTEDCSVGEVCRDRSAAVSIARRAL